MGSAPGTSTLCLPRKSGALPAQSFSLSAIHGVLFFLTKDVLEGALAAPELVEAPLSRTDSLSSLTSPELLEVPISSWHFFFGVRISAHEIAHLIGCPHDGQFSGAYSSVHCPWDYGYIMSYKIQDSNSMKFSSCCQENIKRGICIRVEFTENLRWLMQLTAEFEEGMINARIRIVPLQTHERSEDGRMAHILIEIPDDVSNYNEDYETKHVTERLADIVYPELFVVVDSAFAAVFNSTADIIKYVSVSVNAMNLKYLGIIDPKVKHRLVGLEVTTVEQEQFLRRVTADKRFVHSQRTLASFQTYITQNSKVYEKADLIYLITGTWLQ
ncbi:hypothetical protein MRX96_056356 [Rhipicephalus microplus]